MKQTPRTMPHCRLSPDWQQSPSSSSCPSQSLSRPSQISAWGRQRTSGRAASSAKVSGPVESEAPRTSGLTSLSSSGPSGQPAATRNSNIAMARFLMVVPPRWCQHHGRVRVGNQGKRPHQKSASSRWALDRAASLRTQENPQSQTSRRADRVSTLRVRRCGQGRRRRVGRRAPPGFDQQRGDGLRVPPLLSEASEQASTATVGMGESIVTVARPRTGSAHMRWSRRSRVHRQRCMEPTPSPHEPRETGLSSGQRAMDPPASQELEAVRDLRPRSSRSRQASRPWCLDCLLMPAHDVGTIEGLRP